MKHFRMYGLLGASAIVAGALLSLPAIAGMMAPPSISIVSPAMGASVTSAEIPVTVDVKNFRLECASMGKTTAPMGEGHIHAMVDGMSVANLTSVACSDTFAISGQGLKPGKHMLTVVLANDAHAMNSLPTSVAFDYAPSAPKALPAAASSGKATVQLVSPKNGASVGRKFDLVLAVNNFDLSCALEGKPNVAGWGHVHVFVQQAGESSAAAATPMVAMMSTPEGMTMAKDFMMSSHMTMDEMKPLMMMSMPSMIGMPCTKSIPIDLSNWHSGPAKIVVQLANNDHMPTMGVAPVVFTVNVK
ncbi:MAG TPA: hypothetical protein VNF68_01940 [Candidatus Baltobacteraceae bacterium]|nr:hypothetical protein [Candidatus Baltobacteraceae bacterium]